MAASPSGSGGPGGAKGHRPKRFLGQNFLVDVGIQRRIVEEVGAEPGDTVLEIGPGKGALTRHLAPLVDRLILVELDRELAGALESRFSDDPGVEVRQEDILDLPLGRVTSDPERLRVVGNIPYNLTTPILFHLLERPRPREILLMVQREVADRILAPPGGRTYGALSVGVRTVAEVERILNVSAGAFRPRPRVESTVVRIRPLDPPPLSETEEEALRRLTRALFQWRRKQLGTTLREHPDLALGREGAEALLEKLGVEPRARPEKLSPEDFVRLARAWQAGPHSG